ncbi:MAG: hypothetical protein ACRDYX_16070 [Egibacteraceae bacterium]
MTQTLPAAGVEVLQPISSSLRTRYSGSPLRPRCPPGVVLRDVAVMLGDGCAAQARN